MIRKEVREIMRALGRISSPSGKEEGIRGFLEDFLKDLGYYPRRFGGNLILEKGNFFVGTHMDTVKERRPYSEDSLAAYGTGVCDAKGSIASILLATSKVESLRFSLFFFENEEEGGTGSLEFSKKHDPAIGVVMEPTRLKVATRHYGSLELRFDVSSKEVHGAFPELGPSAIDRFLAFYSKLRHSGGSCYVRKIEGGSEDYVVPGKCYGIVEFVFPPEIKVKELKRRISELSSLFKIKIKFEEAYDGFELEGRAFEVLAEAISRSGEKVEKCEMPSWTDAINLYSAGWDVVVWGPGDLSRCHTREESIEFREIERASQILVSLNELLEGSSQ